MKKTKFTLSILTFLLLTGCQTTQIMEKFSSKMSSNYKEDEIQKTQDIEQNKIYTVDYKIAKAQKNLNFLGYNIDIDGTYNWETQDALLDFRKKYNVISDYNLTNGIDSLTFYKLDSVVRNLKNEQNKVKKNNENNDEIILKKNQKKDENRSNKKIVVDNKIKIIQNLLKENPKIKIMKNAKKTAENQLIDKSYVELVSDVFCIVDHNNKNAVFYGFLVDIKDNYKNYSKALYFNGYNGNIQNIIKIGTSVPSYADFIGIKYDLKFLDVENCEEYKTLSLFLDQLKSELEKL